MVEDRRAFELKESTEEAERLFIEDFDTWVMTGYYLYSKLRRAGVSAHIGTRGMLDQINVNGVHYAMNGFDPIPFAPGGAYLECIMLKGCGAAGWTFAAIGAIPFASIEEGGVTVTREGLEAVTSHLAQFGEHAPNQAMIDRLASQLGSEATGADANFYTHELLESEYMNSGLDYDAAHAAALEDAGVSPFSLYHPEVIQQFPEYFNNAWRAFWELQ